MGAAIVSLILGLVTAAVGVFLMVSGFQTAQLVSELSTLPRLTATALEEGQRGYLEGVLGGDNQTAEAGMVAYTRYTFEGIRQERVADPTSLDGYRIVEEPIWRQRESLTPPLTLTVGETTVQLAGDSYSLGNPPAQWPTAETADQSPKERFEGFRPGDQVVAVGRVKQDRVLVMRALYGGTYTDYMNAFESGRNFAVVAGIASLVLGLLLSGVGVVILINNL